MSQWDDELAAQGVDPNTVRGLAGEQMLQLANAAAAMQTMRSQIGAAEFDSISPRVNEVLLSTPGLMEMSAGGRADLALQTAVNLVRSQSNAGPPGPPRPTAPAWDSSATPLDENTTREAYQASPSRANRDAYVKARIHGYLERQRQHPESW